MTRDFVTLTPTNGSRSHGELVTTVGALLSDVRGSKDAAQGDTLARARTAERAMKAAIHAERQLADLYSRIAQLEQLAITDELTGLLNRRGFEAELRRALALARRYGEPGVLVYADLDGFKQVNDRYGHAAGDTVLRHVAHQLKHTVRQTDCIGRLGGDEFCVLLFRTTTRAARRRLHALRSSLNPSAVPWQSETLLVGASLGIQAYDGTETDSAAVLRRADAAMYAAKRHGAEKRSTISPPVYLDTGNLNAPLLSTP